MVKIALMGKAGCGKGTYAQMLEQEFKVKKVVMGDILRAEAKKKSDLGKKIAELIDKGNLVPDEIAVKLIYKKLKSKNDAIIDGFPRSLGQVNLYEKLGGTINKIIYLKCSDEVVMGRLLNRITCSKCDWVYNKITNPPKTEGLCNICDSKLVVRKDETEEGVKKRLSWFDTEVMPVIDYYKKKGLVIEIDAEKPINEVYENIRKIFLELRRIN